MILTSDLGCSSPVGCKNPMQWFLSSFQSPCVYIYVDLYIYNIYLAYTYVYTYSTTTMYQTSTLKSLTYFSWKKNTHLKCQSKKHNLRRKRLFCTWTISSTWSWPCFSRDVGCRITSKPSGFNPKKIIPFLNQRFPRVLRIPPETKTRGFL